MFFILPVKVKYLAGISAAFVLYSITMDPLPMKLAAVVSIGNYLLFFAPEFWRMALVNRQTQKRRKDFQSKAQEATPDTWHRCVVCGRTEHDDPNLEFRVAEDDHEYCMEHIGQAPGKKH